MKQLKLLLYILLAFMLVSCYSINDPCDINDFWESAGKAPANINTITAANNGDIWVTTFRLGSGGVSGIHLSTDNGDTWVQKCFFDSHPLAISVNPMNGDLCKMKRGKKGWEYRN